MYKMQQILDKIIDNIRAGKKPGGRTISMLNFDEDITDSYGTNDKLIICYMIANEMCVLPVCDDCSADVRFISAREGFAKKCRKCKMIEVNSHNNKYKNSNRKEKLKHDRIKILSSASSYYLNNISTIKEVSRLYNVPYDYLRRYLRDNNCIKTNNSHLHNSKNFLKNVDDRLLNKEYLHENIITHGKNLKTISVELGVSPNTVRIYAKKHDIISKGNISKGENEISALLGKYDNVINRSKKIIPPYEIDVYSPKFSLGIEYNGEYWHNETRKEKGYHLNKHNLAEKNGIKLIQIFEHEWLNKKDILTSMIKTQIGDYTKEYARTLKFVELDKMLAKEFFDENHLQGWIKCKYAFGLVDRNDMIVSAISFGKPRFNTKYEYELLRFANKLNTSTIGGFSKLLHNSIKTLNIKSIISYSHKRLFNGNVYERAGFKKINETSPGYFWYSNKTGQILSRFETQKHKLNTDLTEKQYMINAGFSRVFDCGQNVFAYGDI